MRRGPEHRNASGEEEWGREKADGRRARSPAPIRLLAYSPTRHTPTPIRPIRPYAHTPHPTTPKRPYLQRVAAATSNASVLARL